MSDEKQPEDSGSVHLRKQLVDFHVRVAELRDKGKTLPPGGVIFYNLQVMLQATGDELMMAIARDLGVPIDCVSVRLVIDPVTADIIPKINLQLPKFWVTGVKGLTGNDADLKNMADMYARSVIDKHQEELASVVVRRMKMFL